jgi:general secretion pathway protein L
LRTAQSPWLDSLHRGWDLAQFKLSFTSRSRKAEVLLLAWKQWWQHPDWRSVRWGVAGLLLVSLLGLNTVAWQERRALQQLERDTRSLLTQTFPHISVVLDAPRQMAHEVTALRHSRGELGGHDLAPILSALGSLPPTVPLALQQLEYTEQRLVLQHGPLPAEAHTQLAGSLHTLGWTPASVSEQSHTFTRTARP